MMAWYLKGRGDWVLGMMVCNAGQAALLTRFHYEIS